MPLNYLVFSGGGARSICFCGVLSVLQNFFPLYQAKGIIGTSAGSIFGLMMILKYLPHEMMNLLMENDFSKTAGDIKLFNIVTSEYCGMSNGEKMRQWIESIIEAKGVDKNITFSEFFDKTGIKFVVAATNLNRENVTYFSHETFPDMKVARAIQISSSYPFIFEVQKHQGEYYTDGGVLNNFPINYFPEKETLGFNLLYTLDQENYFEEINSRKDLLYRLLVVGVNHQETRFWKGNNVVDVVTGNEISPMDYSISYEQKIELFKKGEQSAWTFLQKISNNKDAV